NNSIKDNNQESKREEIKGRAGHQSEVLRSLKSMATGIHKLRHTADQPGGDSGLLGDRALDNSS
ncbi:hypothetical protein Tco_1463301, partial [Tanacetum coccineum]